MTLLKISSKAKIFCENAILITGSARSGTSLVGSIIHSMENVEYAYEPPMMIALLPFINEMNESQWRLLYESYLYEEFLLNSIAGRSINCNTCDYSSIYKTKSPLDINNRLTNHYTKSMAQKHSDGKIIAYKIPDVVYIVPKIKEYYPSMRIVIMLREAVSTINSLIQKKWFARENENSDLIWPYKINGNINIPYWVKKCDEKTWISMSEIDRAAYYYIMVNEHVSNITDRLEIKYSNLIKNPIKEVERISENLHLKFGEKTLDIIKGISASEATKNNHILNDIREDLRKKVVYYSELSQ